MRWHRLDPTDAYFSYDMEVVYIGLEMPSEDALRRAFGRLGESSPHMFRFTDHARGAWRPLTAQELREAPERLVDRVRDDDPRAGWQVVHDSRLDGFNIRIFLGDGWFGFRAAHGALMDGFSIGVLLQQLLGADGPARVQVLPSWRRDLMLSRYLAGHPQTVRAALAYRKAMNAHGWEPAPVVPDEHTFTTVVSPRDYVPTLRALRDQHWPGASLSTLGLVGFRAAMATVGAAPRAGAEMLFDVRSFLPTDVPLFGNWSTGVQIEADDDYDPSSVVRALHEVASSGLPVAAMAASRVTGRAARREILQRPVPRPVGAPRISYTHLGPHSTIGRLPWRTDRPTYVLERTRPANAEAMTVMVKELGGYFMFNVSHYDCVWPAPLVREAVELFLGDPVGVIRTAQAEVSGARKSLP